MERGEEEILLAHVVYALVDGENPVKVWREYRQLTQQQLAEAVGISAPFLAQIETGKRKGSINMMAGLAKTLLIALDDLIPNG